MNRWNVRPGMEPSKIAQHWRVNLPNKTRFTTQPDQQVYMYHLCLSFSMSISYVTGIETLYQHYWVRFDFVVLASTHKYNQGTCECPSTVPIVI